MFYSALVVAVRVFFFISPDQVAHGVGNLKRNFKRLSFLVAFE